MRIALDELLEAMTPILERTVVAQIADGCLHDATYEELERAVVRAQSPFWDIVIDPQRCQRDKDMAHQRMVELADVQRAFRMWTREGLERLSKTVSEGPCSLTP